MNTGDWAGEYEHDLLNPESNYIQELARNPKASSPEIIKKVAAARALGEQGNYADALAELKPVQGLLVKQFLALKEIGLAESRQDIAEFKKQQKELSDRKRRAMSNL